MNKTISVFQSTIYMILAIMLVGCVPNHSAVTPLQGTITPVKMTETTTISPSPQPTLTNTPTQTATSNPEPKPFPTQGELNDKDFVIQLLQTNGGCELPCWWGIVPRETKWNDAERFLSGFATRIEKKWDETENGTDGTTHQIRHFVVYVDIGETEPQLFAVRTRDDLVTGIYVDPPLTELHFSLKELLNNQGIPTKIFLHTHSNIMEPPVGYYFILYYREQRLLAVYTTLVYKENEQIAVCLDDVAPSIAVTSKEEELTDKEIQEFFLGPDPLGVLSVEDALGMTATAFYETYRDSQPICITTPANIWP